MSAYVRVDRGTGPRAGQLLQHRSDPKRWQVKVFLFRDEHGRKRYRTEVVHGKKRRRRSALTRAAPGAEHRQPGATLTPDGP